MTFIDSIGALEGVLGKTPPAVHLKVIDHLDSHALRWLAASPLMFAGIGGDGAIAITIGGGAAGFASGRATDLHLLLAALDNPEAVVPGRSFCSLFIAPGIGETLRINGRVADVEDGLARIAVGECYVHCAKALIRSAFWSAEPVTQGAGDIDGFVADSRFLALATIDADGHADLSPKGDPAGRLARLDGGGRGAPGGRLWFADRPGNRRADSFRNMIAQPRMAGILIVPGSDQVAVLTGTARLTSDEQACAPFTVQDRLPPLAVRVDEPRLALRTSPALARARLWPAGARAEGIDPAKAFVAHVKLNKDKGLGARLTGAVLSVPGLMRKGLEQDYKSNLY